MFCANCGKQLNDTARFCDSCGAPAESVPAAQVSLSQAPAPQPEKRGRKRKPTPERPVSEGERVTPHITLGADGKYRWIYEMSLFRNPTIFLLIWKIFFFIMLGIFAFIMLIEVFEGDMDLERFLLDLKIMGIVLGVMTALIGVSMLIYAAIMGGKYIVMFEMDEKGINHKQVPTQAKKARKIGTAAALLGAASGNMTAAAAGLNAARTEMYSEFSRTKKVRAYPRRDLIKVNSLFNHNQVYAEKEDFDFVVNYILRYVSDQAKPR